MARFFPWGFQFGAPSESFPSEGCPLEDHPKWDLKAGTGPSGLCWASSSGRDVLVGSDNDTSMILAYNESQFVNGTVAAKVNMVTTGDTNWLLPLAGRMIDIDNMIGARWNDSHYQVVQRDGGTWTTLFDGGTPAVGDNVVFILSSKYWKLLVNGVQIADGETTLPDIAGWWGISHHQAPDYVGHVLCRGFTVSDASYAKTPCMTGFTSPYGEVSASSWWDEGIAGCPAKPCRCRSGSSGSARPINLQWSPIGST